MAEKKYARYLTTDVLRPVKDGARLLTSTRHLEPYTGGDFSIDCGFITEPVLMINRPHKHDFDQYICFFGANRDNAGEFDAVIEISLGEEREKQVITRPTIVHVPAGMPHGPLNFAEINKPVLFVDIAQSNRYYRVWEAEETGD